MKNKGHVLICGASIAGPCLAYWLNRAGFKTTVIERAPKFRDGGQNIDVKGAGAIVVERMGLMNVVKAKTTQEQGLRFVDASGSSIAEFPKDGELSITQEIEILRGDLSRVFYEATKENTAYRFGVSVRALRTNSDSVHVELSDGSSEQFDLVVSAEGLGSPTRKLVMNEFVTLKYLGVWMAYFRIPKLPRDDKWASWYNAVGGRVILKRPSTPESESVCLDFRSEDPNVDHQPLEIQREKIRKILTGMGWESDRISKNLDYDDDLYMGPVSQVKASQWSKGRFALVGDAAHAPSPITGMGTSLAITGAYVLAGELAKSDSVLGALESYEKILRPFVEKSQSLPPGVPKVAHPKTRLGISVLNSCAKVAASGPVQKLLKRFTATDKKSETTETENGFNLPDYSF